MEAIAKGGPLEGYVLLPAPCCPMGDKSTLFAWPACQAVPAWQVVKFRSHKVNKTYLCVCFLYARYTGKGAPGETDLSYGSRQVLPATTSLEDRNRTAPMPFCGNRFELRALGSAANPSFLMTCLAGVLSDGCDAISDNVERKGMSLRDSVADVVTKNANIMFNGDGCAYRTVGCDTAAHAPAL